MNFEVFFFKTNKGNVCCIEMDGDRLDHRVLRSIPCGFGQECDCGLGNHLVVLAQDSWATHRVHPGATGGSPGLPQTGYPATGRLPGSPAWAPWHLPGATRVQKHPWVETATGAFLYQTVAYD